MANINTALAASKDAIEQVIEAGERTGPAWTAPRAPGKWSPSQIVEHLARSLEESANMAAGRPSKFPKLPAVVHPVVRGLLFKRVLRRAAFPKARTNKAMNPASRLRQPKAARAWRTRTRSLRKPVDRSTRAVNGCGPPSSAPFLWRSTCGSWSSIPGITASKWSSGSRGHRGHGIRRAACESHPPGVRRSR